MQKRRERQKELVKQEHSYGQVDAPEDKKKKKKEKLSKS